jgi:type III pantothenate kinase
MVLCDIGNSTFNFFYDNKNVKYPIGKLPELEDSRQVFFISVNKKGTRELLKKVRCKQFVDLSIFCKLDTGYRGLGIDRAVACCAVDDGIIVDAGSAITVDIMQNGIHLGGYIMPGITQYRESFKRISPELDREFNSGVDIDNLPFQTVDAISYGVFKSIYLMISDSWRNNKMIYFTGGDGKFLSKYFESSIYESNLLFRGMKKIVEENNLLIR